jgi:hypothetical protein
MENSFDAGAFRLKWVIESFLFSSKLSLLFIMISSYVVFPSNAPYVLVNTCQ